MYTVTEPVEEDEVLAATYDEIEPEAIIEKMESNAEYCVDHLCGCK